MRVPRHAISWLFLAACGSFGEADDAPPPGPPPASDGGPIGESDGGTIEVPEEPITPSDPSDPGSSGAFCKLKVQTEPKTVFCSDFDDKNPWAGWTLADPGERYDVDPVNFTSPLVAAKLSIVGPVLSSPDARLRHNLKTASHFTLSAQVRILSQNDTDAVVLRLQFAKGSIFLRSNGALYENVVTESGTTTVPKLDVAKPPQNQWLPVVFDLDLPSGAFSLTVDGAPRNGTVTKRQPEGPLIVVGPAEPRKSTSGPALDMWLDDFVVVAQ